MPGKGAARSRSTPRERPSSSMGRPQTALNNSNNTFGFTKSSYGGSPGGSPRVGTPTGTRRLSALNLAGGSNLDCSASQHFGSEKCICGICTCGQHKCPVQSKTSIFYGGDSSFGTTHGDAFVNHDSRHYQPRASRASQVYTPGERFDHTTTHQNDFPWHEHERPSSSLKNTMERSTPLHGGPDVRMDLTTSYGSHFIEHPMPSKSMKPSQATYSYGSPREFTTTKQLDYNGLQPARCPATILPTRPGSARSGHVKYNMDFTGTWR